MGFIDKLQYAWIEALDSARLVRLSLQMLLGGGATLSDISGPVGIVHTISQVAEESGSVSNALLNVLYFTAFIAVNLAVMNLLPIPALDGSKVLLLLYEGLRGKPIAPEKEGFLNMIGFAFLMTLIIFVTFKDVMNLFG